MDPGTQAMKGPAVALVQGAVNGAGDFSLFLRILLLPANNVLGWWTR